MIGSPGTLLAAATDRLLAADQWTLTARPDHFHLEAAVRPGVQWFRNEGIFGGDADAGLIRDGYAYLYGMSQATMVGYTRSSDEIEAVIGARWLRCAAEAYLSAGNDHSAVAQVLKLVPTDSVDVVRLHRLETSGSDRTAILSGPDHGVWAVRLDDPGGPLLVGFGADPAKDLLADLRYGDRPLALPDPAERGVITLEEALVGFAARRARTRRRSDGRREAQIDVTAPEDGDSSWSISSHDLLPAWGATTGYQVEEMVRELIGRQNPQLLAEVEFDSYPEAFSAYTVTALNARALADLLRRKPT